MTRINHEIRFSWQAHYLVKLKCHFSWQAQYSVKFGMIAAIGTTIIRAAEYLQVPASLLEIFWLVRILNSCQPRGLQLCTVAWRGRRYGHTETISACAGDYLHVMAPAISSHFRNTDSFFYGGRRFAVDAHRIMTEIFDTMEMELSIHAVSDQNVPLGARQITINMAPLVDPDLLWRNAIELWGDHGTSDASRLVHIEPQPGLVQEPYTDMLHLVLLITPQAGTIPALFALQIVAAGNHNNVAFAARLCRTPATNDNLLFSSGFFRLVRSLGTEHPFNIPPGAFIVVRIQSPFTDTVEL